LRQIRVVEAQRSRYCRGVRRIKLPMKRKTLFSFIACAVLSLSLAAIPLRAQEPSIEEIPAPGETIVPDGGGQIIADGEDGGVITIGGDGGGEVPAEGDGGEQTTIDGDEGGDVIVTTTDEGGETVTADGEEGTVVVSDDTTGTPGPSEGTIDDPGIYSPLAESNSPTSQTVNSIQSSGATDTNNWNSATIQSGTEADGYSVEDGSKQTVLKATRQKGRVFLKTQP
jgi:hypothetical protein